MKFGSKVAIFLAAALITFVGFSMIASPAVDMAKVGKEAGYEIITNYLAKVESGTTHNVVG